MVRLNRVAIDVLKPHEPTILQLGEKVGEHEGVDNVEIKVYAVDKKTESVTIIVEGEDLNYEELKNVIEEESAVVHSIDLVNIVK